MKQAHISRRAWSLQAGVVLLALTVACAWGVWAAAQAQTHTFMLPGAREVQQAPIGPGMRSLVFVHDGPVAGQMSRLRAAAARHGWQVVPSLGPEDCEDRCLLGVMTLVFTRRSLLNLVHEVATIEQRGVGPYHVRIVHRRCVRLPWLGCWPPG